MHRHATDIISLVFGIIFAGFALVWLLHVTDVIDLDDVWLVGPAVLIVAGLLGLVTALRPRTSADPDVVDPSESSPRAGP